MEMKLRFLGAAQNVTGSRTLLEVNGASILIDCGLYQERQFRDRNWEPFTVDPSTIDAVLLTHAHLDHCGLLPKLVREGFRGKIHCTTATAKISTIVLLDAAKIQVEDAEYKKKRHKREKRKSKYPEEPLYTIEDAEECLPLFAPVHYDEPVTVSKGVEVSFHDAGHILGASMIKLSVQNGDEKRLFLFSGDIGRWDKPILRDPTVFDEADYVQIESTYGDRVHENDEDTKELMSKVINATNNANGNIIIPSFSVERSQEILYCLNELMIEKRIPKLMVFLDSPMAIKVTKVFKDHPEMFDSEMADYVNNNQSPFDLPNLMVTRTANESKAINHIGGTVIVIAGSGMCTGGRVKHHLVNNIARPESAVLFVGYQANGTLGRSIVDGAKEVRILGQKHRVKADIVRVHGFSGHADRDELYRWLSNIKKPPRKVFVVHGEENSARQFGDFIREKTGWDVCVPKYMDEVALD